MQNKNETFKKSSTLYQYKKKTTYVYIEYLLEWQRRSPFSLELSPNKKEGNSLMCCAAAE